MTETVRALSEQQCQGLVRVPLQGKYEHCKLCNEYLVLSQVATRTELAIAK